MPRTDLTDHALFCLRSPAFSQALYAQAQGSSPPAREVDFIDPACGRLDALKVRIRASGLLGLENYTSIEDFGARIEAHLLAALDRYFPASEMPSAAQRREAAHAAFRHHRLQNFLPRPDVRETLLARMAERLERPSLGPILLAGPSGQGKSALMADLARYLETTDAVDTPQGDVRYRVIDHYIGADDASNLDAWILRLLEILHPEIEHLTGPIPEATKDRREALSTWLAYAARQSERQALEHHGAAVRIRFALLLDAVDQVGDRGADLDLLKPEILGPDAILVASAADGTPAAQHERFQTTLTVPPLDDALRATLISATLQRFRKTLPDADARRLAQAPQAGSPLFLGLALEELRIDAHHETLGALVTDILHAPDAAQLFLKNFLLDSDYARPSQPDLAVRFMALLGASRAGLTENELADLLALSTDPVAEDTNAPRLPQKFLSNLLANFGPFLLNKEGRRAPMHRILGEVALGHLGERPIREQLYDHFSPGYAKNGGTIEPRAAAEALYQITCLTQADPANKPRLEDDLAYLPVPAMLYDTEEDVVFAALGEFSFEEKSALAGRWQVQVKSLAEADIEGMGAAMGDFAAWIGECIGHYPAALGLEEPLLEARWRILGEEHPDSLTAMGNLASTLRDQDDLPGARVLQEQVLEACRRIHGGNHPDTLSAMGSLASMLANQGELAGSRLLQEQALEACRRIHGGNHPDTLSAMGSFASMLHNQGELAGSRALQEQALEACRRILGKEHPHTFRAMGNLAVTLYDQGDLPRSRTLQEQVLEARRRILGEEHRSTLTAMSHLSITLHDQGDLPGSRTLQEQVLEACGRILGEEHRDTLRAMSNLAINLSDQGDLPGSRTLQEQVLEVRCRTLGKEHSETLTAMGNLANTLRDQGDLPGARLLQEQVLEVSRRIRGEEHPDMLTAMSDLAFTLHNQSDLPRAHSLRLQVLETRRRILGEMHPQTLSAMTNLATTLLKLGETDQARVLRAEVHSIHRKASSSTEGDTTMRLTETLKQWLVEQEWNEVPEIDVDNQTSSTGFGFTVGDFSLKCWFDINEKTQVCKFFAYFLDTKAPEKKLDEVQKFVTVGAD